MDRPRPYLPSRMVDYGQFTYYYAYGNTPAEDLLEHVHFEDEREPTILSLGCGDARSCFYTLWKHFDPTVSARHFFGARFILNDLSGGVLARNILFLYMATKIPSWKQREAAKQWISSMWAIWYCHELLPIHEETLKEALATLLKFSDTMKSWEGSQHAISQVVSFTDDGTRAAVRRMWDMWLTNKSFKLPESDDRRLSTFDHTYVQGIQVWLEAVGLNSYATELVREDYTHYALHLSMYAEECLGLPCPTDHKVINPTLFEREDGIYTLHYASMPFRCFHHSFMFSKSEIHKLGVGADNNLALIVEDDIFMKHPLLSNSVQQFSMWVSSSAATLMSRVSQQKRDINFSFNCSDCLVFCEELQSKSNDFQNLPTLFDTVFTSNLIDRMPPSILVLVIKPLLKLSSFLLTSTLLYKDGFSSAEKYLTEVFGFGPALLPLLCGVRCVSHDGRYTDSISIHPMPVQLQHVFSKSSGLVSHRDKLLFWQRINSQPIALTSLTDSSFSASLYKTFLAQILSFYNAGGIALSMKAVMCTETVMNTILSFASQLDADVDISKHAFWHGLCGLIQGNGQLRPFLVHIQTQALLHGLHFHLILTEMDCPICLKKPLEKCIEKFSIVFDPLTMDKILSEQGATPMFVVFIHKSPIRFSLNELPSDTHIVDSAHGSRLPSRNLQLNFYFPVQFADEWFFTIVRYLTGKLVATPVATLSGELHRIRVPFYEEPVHFKTAGAHRSKNMSTRLGSILSHIGDGDHMETVLSLAPKPLSLLGNKTTTVSLEHPSPTTVRVVCGKFNFSINYPYPLEYTKCKTQVSRSQSTLQISVSRGSNRVYDDNRVFFTNPSHMMLPTLQLSADNLKTIVGMQYSNLLNTGNLGCFGDTERVKYFISLLFSHTEYCLFACTPPTDQFERDEIPRGFVLIHRRTIEIQRCTPALDVFYILYDANIFRKIYAKWTDLINDLETQDLVGQVPFDESSWILMKHILAYFASRTLQTSKKSSQLLGKHGLEKSFTRAIVYPLYCDQDVVYDALDEQNPTRHLKKSTVTPTESTQSSSSPRSAAPSSATVNGSLTGSNNTAVKLPVQNDKGCSYCGRKSDKLKKCTGCSETWYCDRQCQAGHWKDHKKICKPPVKKATKSLVSEELLTKCSNCDKEAESLKRCGTCQVAAYCSKECQRNDWTKHKLTCTKK